MLDIVNISAGYGSLNAIQNINISIPDGSKLGVFGHNGAGKTTLMRCIIGAHVPSQGEVRWHGEALPKGDVPATVKKGIAYVPQGHNVFPTLSVEKNLRIAGSLFGEEFLDEIFKLFPVLFERRSQRAGSMSGGEQQMLALGMALMTNPKWLLLDEPSTGLAPVIVRNVMDGLRDVNKRFGTGIIVVEQNVPATLKLVDHAIIIKSGQIVFNGTTAELNDKKDLWEWF
ncbi:MAG: ABC transporter ATP-binding protein [Rhizobiales bacterium]|jgi:branched-chain amino acid transport system ATP-binding protein|nr:ABC transporter ATP-binding protein [Hyphomicrobiales bacterium]